MNLIVETHRVWKGFGRDTEQKLPTLRLGFVTLAWAETSILRNLSTLHAQVGDMRKSIGF